MKQSSAKSDLAKLFEKAGAPKFAVGGLSDTSLLSIAASGVRPYYTAAEKDWLAAREREYADYNKAVEAYNQQVSEYQKQIDAYNESIKPYQSEVDAYNKALEDYNRGVEAYRKSLFIAEDNTPKVYERASNRGGWSGRVRDPITGNMLDPGQYYATLGDDNALIARQNPVATIDLTSQIYARGAVRYTDPRTGQVVYEGSISGPPKVTKDYMVYGGKLYEFEKTPGEFTAKMPGTPPAPFAGVAPTAPTNVPYTQEQVKQYSEAAKARAQKSAAQRSSALNVAASPEQYGLSGFGLSLPFKDGGEVSNEDFIQQMTVGTLPESKKDPSLFERYLAERQRRINELREAPVEPPKTFVYSVPGITGLPGYVIGNMLAKKLDLPEDVEEFFGHSKSRGAWNPEDLEEIRTRANGSPEEGEVAQPSEIKATPQNPLLGFLAKALKTREEATKDLNSPTASLLNLILPTSQTVEKWSYGDPLFRMPPSGTGGYVPVTSRDKGYVAETIGYAPIGLPAKAVASGAMVGPPLGVLKPKGGAFPMAGSGSRLDDYLGRVEEVAAQENPGSIANTKAVNEFIRNKGRKYLTSVYGAADDPVREAFLEGRLPKLGTDKERFRNYLMNPAREGDPEALKDFEKFYDEATGLQKFLATQSTDWREAASIKEAAARQMLDKMIKEGVPEESITNTSVDILNPERMLKDYSPEWQKNLARQMQNENLGLERPVSPVDETLFRAVREGETFYDIGYPSLDFMDPRNLGKALATLDPNKLQNMSFAEAIIQGTKNTRLQRDWDEVVRKVRDGKKVDKSMFAIGTEKVQPMGDDTWVRLTNGQAAELEGAAMRHSVGGYAKKGSYGHGGLEALLDGRAQVFSLRDKQGMPRVTIEALKQGDGDLMVTQIRGKFNGLPSDTDQQMIAEFLKGMPVKSVKTDRYHKDILDNELPEPVSIDWQEMLGPKE